MGTLAASPTSLAPPPPPPPKRPLKKIAAVASIAAGIQFGWALQLSLLTPYVQLLGIPHKWAAMIWLCGPISGIVVQPLVGHFSDRRTGRFGRRTPFILSGMVLVAVAVLLIGFAADIGHRYGDSLDEGRPRTRAIAVFVVGFWVLDVSNNMLQGPCRALLGDLSGESQRLTRFANALFSCFMGVGNVLGYLAGAQDGLHEFPLFRFTVTRACDVYCANLKSCFFISAALLILLTVVAVAYVREQPWDPNNTETSGSNLEANNNNKSTSGKSGGPTTTSVFSALRNLDRPMWMLLLVTCLNWIAWFPWVLYDTDWMGREVYGGSSQGDPGRVRLYDRGVRAGSLGLMINSIVLLVVSLAIDPLAGKLGVKMLWGLVNFVLGVCLVMTIVITKLAETERRRGHGGGGVVGPSSGIKNGALAVFGVLGLPLAVTYSIPFAMASIYSHGSGAGQGLSLGVVNLAICLPQMVISLGSGPFDAAFGGGNLPAFIVGTVVAFVSAICAATLLPKPKNSSGN